MNLGNTPFDTIMILLPIWLPSLIFFCVITWLIVWSACLSALRKHARDQSRLQGYGQRGPAS